MNLLIISIAAASLGVDFGWNRLPDGGSEYIIQLDRQTLDALRDGQPIQSDVMPGAGDVRSFRIIVGDGILAKEPPLGRPSASLAVDDSPQLPPNPLLADPAVKPLSNYARPAEKPVIEEPKPAADGAPAAEQPARPWLPLTLTLLGLFASLGANVYLGWINHGLRRRRRAELAEGD
ncbi:MAG: hypothetical protein GX594_03495 [Pirellulaceae bacterium]|nr:hypothetical protein [Pirellulaceae bacterium]